MTETGTVSSYSLAAGVLTLRVRLPRTLFPRTRSVLVGDPASAVTFDGKAVGGDALEGLLALAAAKSQAVRVTLYPGAGGASTRAEFVTEGE